MHKFSVTLQPTKVQILYRQTCVKTFNPVISETVKANIR